MKTKEFIDNCKRCPVPDNTRFYDIESEEYFTCSMCSCYLCPFLHHCNGQCAKNEDLPDEELEGENSI